MYKKLLAAIVIGILAIPAISSAQFKPGDVELTLVGSGTNDKDFTGGQFGAGGSVGWFLTKELEAGIRQSVSFESANNGDFWGFTTRLFADYHFDLDRLQPFIGASIGYAYGRTSSQDLDDVIGGPEAGVKYFLNSTTFVFVQAAYDMKVCNGGWDEGAFVYSLGLGVKL